MTIPALEALHRAISVMEGRGFSDLAREFAPAARDVDELTPFPVVQALAQRAADALHARGLESLAAEIARAGGLKVQPSSGRAGDWRAPPPKEVRMTEGLGLGGEMGADLGGPKA